MKDIEKLKKEMMADMERELMLAELANKCEETSGGYWSTYMSSGQKYAYCKDCTFGQIAKMIAAYPPTERMVLNRTATSNGDRYAFYKLQSVRGYSDRISQLVIDWKHDDVVITMHVTIESQPKLEKFFTSTWRNLSSSEQSTYKPDRDGRLLYDMKLPAMKFNGEEIVYSGGRRTLLDENLINEIITTIKGE